MLNKNQNLCQILCGPRLTNGTFFFISLFVQNMTMFFDVSNIWKCLRVVSTMGKQRVKPSLPLTKITTSSLRKVPTSHNRSHST